MVKAFVASWDLCGQVGPVVVKTLCGLLGAPNSVVGVCPKVVVRDCSPPQRSS